MAHVYEIFSSIQGEGLYLGKRQIFVRFAGCPLNCVYCDTKYAKKIPKRVSIVKEDSVEFVRNPINAKEILHIIKELETPDLHSISLTGGEPLAQRDIGKIAKALKKEGYTVFLETAGFPSTNLKDILGFVDIVSMDIKLRSHRAYEDYKELISEEKRTIVQFIESGAEVYAKLVILPETTLEELFEALSGLERYDIEIVLQPVTAGENVGVDINKIMKFSEDLGNTFGSRVRIIPQVHKFLRIR